MSDVLNELANHIAAKRPEAVIAANFAYGELCVQIQPAHVEDFVEFLRDDPACRFNSLVDITAIDYPERADRFDVVYHFLSMYQNHRIRVKLSVDEEAMVASIHAIHPSAKSVYALCASITLQIRE